MKRNVSITVSILMVIILFFTVFSFSREVENFTAIQKTYAFYWLTCIQLLLLGGYLALLSHKSPIGFNVNSIDLCLIGWTLYLIVGFLLHHSSPAVDKTLTFVLCVFSYFALRILLAGDHNKLITNILLYGLLTIGILEALTGLLQFYGILPSLNELFIITGTFRNPAPFALFIAACFPIALTAYVFPRGKRSRMLRRLSLVNIVLAILVLPLTGIRASWIAAIAGSLVVLEFKFRLLRRWSSFIRVTAFRRWMAYSLVIIGLAGSALFLYKLKASSADTRLLVWQISMEKILSKPVFGVGYGNFKEQYGNWQADYFGRHPAVLSRSYGAGVPVNDFAGYVKMAYNEYLQIFVEQGLAGEVIFLCLLFICIRSSLHFLKRRRALVLIGSSGGLIALLVSGLFSYPFYSLPTFLLFFVLLAFAGGIASGRVTDVNSLAYPKYAGKGTGLCFLLLSVCLAVYTLSNTRNYRQYQHARELVLQGKAGEARNCYANVFSALKTDPDYLLDYGICLMNNKQPDSAFTIFSLARSIDSDPRIYLFMGNILKERNAYKESEEMYHFAHLMLPSRIYPKYLLTLLYERKRDTVSAVHMARDILNTPLRQGDRLGESIMQEMSDLLIKYRAPKNEPHGLIEYGQLTNPSFNN